MAAPHLPRSSARRGHRVWLLTAGFALCVAATVALGQTTSCEAATRVFTVSQQENTAAFLSSLLGGMGLSTAWLNTMFCCNPYVSCTVAGAALRVAETVIDDVMPEIPDGVVASEVVVTVIDCSFSGVTGPLPVSWASLPSLQVVSFQNATVSGTLPLQWSAMASVYKIDLSNNGLFGALPTAWSRLSNLMLLDLSDNQLTGTVPAAWSSLLQLETLSLTGNALYGTLPSSWDTLVTLKFLGLGGIPAYGFEGTLPNSWGSMRSLKSLLLANNKLTGAIPASWGELMMLSWVALTNNQLCGCLPPRWKSTAWMTVAVDPSVSAADCATANQCAAPPSPSSSGSSSSDADMDTCHSAVRYYTAAQVEQTRRFLDAFPVSLPALQLVWACPNFCVRPYVVCDSEGVAVDTTGVPMSGSLPDVPAGVDGAEVVVTSLRMGGDFDLAGSLPAAWGSLTRMQELRLRTASADGTLPEAWASMSALRVLEVSDAFVDGVLPEAWGSMSGLRVLNLSSGFLTGTIPAAWGGMAALQELHLGSNVLVAPLPDELGQLSKLEVLDLRQSALGTTLPEMLGNLKNLRTLLLDNNALRGPVPAAYAGLENLTHVTLQRNTLCGCLPEAWMARYNVTLFITADASVLSPECGTTYGCNRGGSTSSSSAGPSTSSSGSSSSMDLSSSSSTPDECHAPVPFFNDTEVANSRMFLDSFTCSSVTTCGDSACPNFCVRVGVTCDAGGISLNLTQMGASGALPPVPADCNPADVKVTSIVAGESADAVTLEGSLPDNWGGLTTLGRLELPHTGLKGTLPAAWAGMRSLTVINLAFNALSGPLPDEWQSMASLTWVGLNDNHLTGSFPYSWSNIQTLTHLDLANNNLTGTLDNLSLFFSRAFVRH